MSNLYGKWVEQTPKAIDKTTWEVMNAAQRICPDGWVFHIMAYPEMEHGKLRQTYHADVTNGDDAVTGIGRTIGAAVARLVASLLDGAVYPLTGNNGGRYILPDADDESDAALDAAGGE